MKTKTYETMVVLDNREVKRGWQTLKDNVTEHFTKHGAEVLSAKRWAEQRLAYPMKGQQRATYLLVYYKSETDQIDAIRRDLEYDEAVLRNLTKATESIPEDAYQPEEEFDETEVKVEEVGQPLVEEPEEASDEAGEGESDAAATDGEATDGEATEGAEASTDAAEGDAADAPEGAVADSSATDSSATDSSATDGSATDTTDGGSADTDSDSTEDKA